MDAYEKKKRTRKEEEDELTRLTVAATWQSFQSGTTSHGLPHIINAKGWFKKLLWLLSTLVCLMGLSYNYYQLFTKFLSYNVSVSVSLQHSRTIDFPAITVCNNNPIQASAIPVNSDMNDLMNEFTENTNKNCNLNTTANVSTSTISPFTTASSTSYYDYNSNNSNYNYPADCYADTGITDDEGRSQRADYVFQNQFLESISELKESNKSRYGHQLYNMIEDCDYGGSSCEMSDFDVFFNNYHGNCFVFNSKMFKSANKTLKISKKSGPRFGLSLTFNLEQKEYIGELTKSAGLRLVVHDPHRMPYPEDEGILVAPLSLTNIGVYITKTSKMDGVYGDCFDEIKYPNKSKSIYKNIYNASYSEKDCHYSCLAKEIEKTCNCMDIKFPIPDYSNSSMKPCSSDNQTQLNCLSYVWSLYDEDKLACSTGCKVPCSQTHYRTIISSENWPSESYLQSMTALGPNTKIANAIIYEHSKDYGVVKIFIQDFTYTSIIESPAYELQDFVSDIGGILGLYIGFSILTIVEFVELFLDLLKLFFVKTFSRKKRKTKDDIKSDRSVKVAPMPEKTCWEEELSGKDITPSEISADLNKISA